MNSKPRKNWLRSGRTERAFTLIELMVAMAIAVLMMMTALPYFQSGRKTPLVRATNDLLEACRRARLTAIMTGNAMQVVIYEAGAAIGVEPVPAFSPAQIHEAQADSTAAAELEAAATREGGVVFEARLDDEVAFQRPLLINGRDFFDSIEQAAAIRFFPNGTSDSLEAELQWLQQDARRISLDVMTGQPEVRGMR